MFCGSLCDAVGQIDKEMAVSNNAAERLPTSMQSTNTNDVLGTHVLPPIPKKLILPVHCLCKCHKQKQVLSH